MIEHRKPERKFYVYNVTQGSLIRRLLPHTTLESALKESERLARLMDGDELEVMQVLCSHQKETIFRKNYAL